MMIIANAGRRATCEVIDEKVRKGNEMDRKVNKCIVIAENDCQHCRDEQAR